MSEKTAVGWLPADTNPPGRWIVAYRDHGERLYAVGYCEDGAWQTTDWGNDIPNPELIHDLPHE